MIEIDPAHAHLATPLAEALGAVEARFEAQLTSEFPAVSDLCEHVARYRGKMLRPTLTLLSGLAAAEGDASVLRSDALVRLAAVVEMIHMATLVHDDVLDEADDRRGGRTVNRLRGNETAVMLGDYLISNAFHLAATIGDAGLTVKLGDVTNTLCEGELIQLHHRDDLGMDFSTYLEIVRRKTAVLVGGCGRLGASVVGGDEATCEALGSFGEELGIAFQVRDDVLDLEGDADEVGKTLGRDLAKGKLTLPVILLMDTSTSDRFEDAVEAFQTRDSRRLLELLRESDCIDRALDFARERVEAGIESIAGVELGGTDGLLRDLAGSVITRRR